MTRELPGQSAREREDAEIALIRNLAVELARVLNQFVDYEHDVAPKPDTGAVLRRARQAGLLNARRPEGVS